MDRRRSSQIRLVLMTICAVAWLGTGPAWAAGGGRSGPRTLAALQASVAQVEDLVHRAYFRKATGLAEATREWAADIPRSAEAAQARARLEVLLCTAQVALGDEAGALRSMQRAVYVWPLLSLDESDTSPRVVRVFRRVRGGGTAGGGR